MVLNQQLYTIFADPVDVKTYKTNTDKLAAAAATVLGGSESDYRSDVTAPNTRYSIMARRVSKDQRDKLMAYKFAGVYSEVQDYRTYPQGSLASQLLGFVDNDGNGQYGLEQSLNKQLSGTAGNWTVSSPIALTSDAGLDSISRPDWFVPADQMPPPTPAPATPTPAATVSSGSPAAPSASPS